MKVINRVNPVETFTKQCTCSQCTSTLEVDAKDLQHTPSSGGNQRDYEPEKFFVTCPVCYTPIHMNSAEIPHLVKRRTRERCAPRGGGPWDR